MFENKPKTVYWFLFVFLGISLATCVTNAEQKSQENITLQNNSIESTISAMEIIPPSITPTLTPVIPLVEVDTNIELIPYRCPLADYDSLLDSEGFSWDSTGTKLLLNQIPHPYWLNASSYFSDSSSSPFIEPLPQDLEPYSLKLSANDEYIAFTSKYHTTPSHNALNLFVFQTQENDIKQLTEYQEDRVDVIAWAYNNEYLAYTLFAHSSVWVISRNGSHHAELNWPESRTVYNIYALEWVINSNWIAVLARTGTSRELSDISVFLLDADGAGFIRLFPEGDCIVAMEWSPDGQYLAFSKLENDRANLYTINIATSEVKKLTEGQGHHIQPNWSHNGQKITYLSVTALQPSRRLIAYYQQDIYQVDVNGDNNELIIAMNEDECCLNQPTWIPNQNALSFFVETVENCSYRWEAECQLHIDAINLDDNFRYRLITLPKQ